MAPGEAIGIIGRNGAGKSTLLKLLTRITEPTSGEAVINGRVASLLEVGTGFHPELTGRENIYMNGTILGMKKGEIDRKFDEIVEFSEIERFIDTPVKRYSSGMYVRLAFSVAAHLEPEILLVDEVLAVGDAKFQQKCLGKMSDVSQGGRTVLFVSHNMPSIQALCRRTLVLGGGRIVCDGPTETAIQAYMESLETSALDRRRRQAADATTAGGVIRDVYLAGSDGQRLRTALTGQAISIAIGYRLPGFSGGIQFAIGIYSAAGEKILHLGSHYTEATERTWPQQGVATCRIPRLPLLPGRYWINVSVRDARERIDHVPSACALDVGAGDFFGTGKLPAANESKVLVDHGWTACEAPP